MGSISKRDKNNRAIETYTTRKGKGITGREKRNTAIETYTTRKGKRIKGGEKIKGTSYWFVLKSLRNQRIFLINRTRS